MWERNVRILVADDNKEIRSALRLVLGELCPGCAIEEARDGLEALDLLETQGLDLMLFDWEAPAPGSRASAARPQGSRPPLPRDSHERQPRSPRPLATGRRHLLRRHQRSSGQTDSVCSANCCPSRAKRRRPGTPDQGRAGSTRRPPPRWRRSPPGNAGRWPAAAPAPSSRSACRRPCTRSRPC